ncbi:adhesion G protein-coupled receptor L3 [Patella vulgata]|uniref:adhesion G protein-coupled receptor L3 n=1 Tax=Patella vulgata TaxID=6465 RepID=UPI0024A8316A|nr:adhesion G protein-coupled receptor L3 [Patella vulgata]
MTNAIKTLTQITDETTQNSSTAQNKTKQFAKESVILVSTLFDSEQDANMETLEYENSSISNDLMETMEKVGELVGDNLPDGNSETIQSENIVLSVGKTDPYNITDINFPGDINTDIKTNAQLPKEIFQSSSDLNTVTYSIISYKSIPNLPTDTDRNLTTGDDNSSTTFGVNSEILAINVYGQDTSKLQSDIVLTFYHLNTTPGNAVCSYLDSSNVWSSQGCKVVNTNRRLTICSCDHLTNFALLMKPTKRSVSEYILHHYEVLSTMTIIGCSISVVCLTITLVTFIAVWRFVQCTRTIILVNLCVALIIALLLFILGVDKTYNQDLCTGIAVGLHFFYLVVFYLMLAEGMEILLTIINVFNSLSKLREVGLLLFAWGVPLIIVVTSAGVTRFHGYGNKNFCWLSIEGGLIWAFIAPALVVILVNVMIVVKIIHAMLTTRVMISKDTRDKAKAAVRSICVLLPVMGVSWGFGILAVNEEWILFDYIFTILNTLQGLFIFIFHCVLNKKVREGLAIHHRRYRSRHTSLSGPSSSRSMSETGRRKSSVALAANSALQAFIKFNTRVFAGSDATRKVETDSSVLKFGETIAEITPSNQNDPDNATNLTLDSDHVASAAAIEMEIGIKPRRDDQPPPTVCDDIMKTQYFILSCSTEPTMELDIDFIDD